MRKEFVASGPNPLARNAAQFVRLTACLLALQCGFAFSALCQSPAPGTQQNEQPSAASPGTSQPVTPRKLPFARDFVRDEWKIWSSPFKRSSYSAHGVKKYVLPLTLISVGLIATDRKSADLLPNSSDQTKWSGRVSQIGGVGSLAAISGVVVLVGKATGNRHAAETGWLGLYALGHAQAVTQVLKVATQRGRPVTDDSNSGFFRGGDSFPSGHSASAFAVATVFAYEYREHIVVPITAYTLASLVAVSRMGARRHWASDVFVGGSLGFLLGRFVYKTHHDPNLPGSPTRTRTGRLIPTFSYGGGIAVLEWRL